MQLTEDIAPLGQSLPPVVILEAPAPTSSTAESKRPSLLRRLYRLLTFDVPIRQKLLFFSGGLAGWILLLGSLAALSVDGFMERLVILGLTSISVVPLIGFAVLLTRALTRPLEALGCQVKALTDRYTGQTEDDGRPIAPISLVGNDEVGDVAKRFNQLTSVLQQISAFKKVIERDDTTGEVYDRRGRQLALLGLDELVIYEVSNSKNRLTPVVSSSAAAAEACSPDIRLDCNLCRARRPERSCRLPPFPRSAATSAEDRTRSTSACP